MTSAKRQAQAAWEKFISEYDPALSTMRLVFMAAFALGAISVHSEKGDRG